MSRFIFTGCEEVINIDEIAFMSTKRDYRDLDKEKWAYDCEIILRNGKKVLTRISMDEYARLEKELGF